MKTSLCTLLIILATASASVSEQDFMVDDEIFALDDEDESNTNRELQTSDAYFQRYRDQFGRRAKRCKFLKGVVPATGADCPPMKIGGELIHV